MFIINVQGGLGNQLFQYALYYHLKSLGKTACLNIDSYLTQNVHQGFELEKIFNINLIICSPINSNHNKFYKLIKYLNGFLVYRLDFQLKLIKFYYEYSSSHKNSKLLTYYNLQLSGYWQKMKYLSQIRYNLHDDLNFNIEEDISILIKEISKDNSVLIHVRGGDYIQLGWELKIDYYQNALSSFSKLEEPNFFVITDDQGYLESLNLPCKYKLIDDYVGIKSYINMYLFSQASNIILSNSTFAWWGAYLNRDYNIVTVPKIWIPVGAYEKIYFPEEWIKI